MIISYSKIRKCVKTLGIKLELDFPKIVLNHNGCRLHGIVCLNTISIIKHEGDQNVINNLLKTLSSN